MPDDPDALIAFLSRSETYGFPGQPVEKTTTHAAHIFLVGEGTCKMKRPVRYSLPSTSRPRPSGAGRSRPS